MNCMKKVSAFLLALLMMLSLGTTAFAADELGSITINGVSQDTVYSIYKLLDLESYDVDAGAYAYKVNADWEDFFATADALNYVTIDDDGYVTWKAAEDDSTVAAFAKLALAYAQTQVPVPGDTEKTKDRIDPVQSSHKLNDEGKLVASGDFDITAATETVKASGVFSNLELGYYLVDSTAGALCGLTTTNPDASVNAKNHVPTIDKQVQEDLTSQWGDKNTADIGQIVNYMTIIHVAAGAENYALHDKMSDGLTFLHDTDDGRGVTEIKHVNSAGVETTLTEGTGYNVKTGDEDCAECTFEVVFTDDFVNTLKPNDRLLVYYNAMLNRNAVIDSANTNESWLEYGEEKYTTHDKTETFTFSIDIVKTDSANKLIDGAEFKIYDAKTGGNEVGVVKLVDSETGVEKKDANGNPIYRRARADEQEDGLTVPIVVKDGMVTVVGFDNGIYYLEETVAPDGYNKLTARQEFTIADENLDAIFNGGIFSTGSGVHVVNKTGSMLPETGGMGTTLFITFGAIAVLGTGVLLVTKKRMGMIQD